MQNVDVNPDPLKVNFYIQKLHGRKSTTHHIDLNTRFRLFWRVKNQTTEEILVFGYQCPLELNGEFVGYYNASRNQFIRNDEIITNDRFRTFLRPEESRDYVWAWIYPSYYGIRDIGRWTFHLSVTYQHLGETKKTKSKKANVIIQDINDEIKTVYNEFSMIVSDGIILDILQNYFGELEPLLDRYNSRLFKAGPIGRIDFLAKDELGPIVIEVKMKIDTLTLHQVRRYSLWAKENLSNVFGNNVRAIVVGAQFENITEKMINDFPVPLALVELRDKTRISVIHNWSENERIEEDTHSI
jgi:hypothetical protein